MTWHTPHGDRILVGHESRVVRAGLRRTVELLEERSLDCSGTMLARQSRKSLLHLFAYVGRYLLRETPDLAPLNAWTEAAVGMAFRQVEGMLGSEIYLFEPGEPGAHYWRNMVWNATSDHVRESMSDEIVDSECDSMDTWDVLIECLRDRILWDRDWEVDFEWESHAVMQTLGIDGEYFDWQLKLEGKNKDAVELLGELCGFRRGEFEGQELS